MRFADVTVRDARAWRALLRGSKGLGESYARGWWDSDDPTTLIRVLARGTAPHVAVLDRAATLAAPALDAVARRRRRGPADDRRNVSAHYDIGDDFFALMLDPSMTYSCALFERPGMSLAEAQEAKLERICRLVGVSPGVEVVEIGTGWGSFAVHAASRHGCSVTTTTISAAQHEHASKLVAGAGLADRVTVLDHHYADLGGTYDRLVSIEMIEAVDWRDHGAFFDTCARLLRPGCTAVMQAIVIADRSFERAKHHDDFVRRHMFPGGCLPSVGSIHASASAAGLRIVRLEDIGAHYPETLRRWRANLREHEREVAELGLGEEFQRLWDFYLVYCEAAFLERRISDVQLVLEKA